MGSFSRFLSRTIYNPVVSVKIEWKRSGAYSRDALIDAVQRGLSSDDDIIQQWFNGDQIIRLLEHAETWDEMLLAVATISGAHEVDQRSLEFVNRVLGHSWNAE